MDSCWKHGAYDGHTCPGCESERMHAEQQKRAEEHFTELASQRETQAREQEEAEERRQQERFDREEELEDDRRDFEEELELKRAKSRQDLANKQIENERWLRLHGDEEVARVKLEKAADLLFNRGMEEDALILIGAARKLDPTNSEVHFLEAVALAKTGNLKRALDAFCRHFKMIVGDDEDDFWQEGLRRSLQEARSLLPQDMLKELCEQIGTLADSDPLTLAATGLVVGKKKAAVSTWRKWIAEAGWSLGTVDGRDVPISIIVNPDSTNIADLLMVLEPLENMVGEAFWEPVRRDLEKLLLPARQRIDELRRLEAARAAERKSAEAQRVLAEIEAKREAMEAAELEEERRRVAAERALAERARRMDRTIYVVLMTMSAMAFGWWLSVFGPIHHVAFFDIHIAGAISSCYVSALLAFIPGFIVYCAVMAVVGNITYGSWPLRSAHFGGFMRAMLYGVFLGAVIIALARFAAEFLLGYCQRELNLVTNGVWIVSFWVLAVTLPVQMAKRSNAEKQVPGTGSSPLP